MMGCLPYISSSHRTFIQKTHEHVGLKTKGIIISDLQECYSVKQEARKGHKYLDLKKEKTFRKWLAGTYQLV